MKKTITARNIFVLLFLTLSVPSVLFAQQSGDEQLEGPLEGLPTLFSVRLSAGYGLGRSRQLYGYNGSTPLYWSTGEGAKLNIALDIPILPIEVVNTDSFDIGSSKTPLVALELEAASGYHLSTGGTTVDPLPDGSLQTTTRTTSYVPITLGLNARASFGAGLPSVYVGAGAGVWLVALYQENVSNSLSPGTSFERKMDPPLPFGIYGALGIELPVMYSADDGNSFFDLFAEVRLTEMSNYVYSYQVISSSGSVTTVNAVDDTSIRVGRDGQRSASSVALALGFKFNIY